MVHRVRRPYPTRTRLLCYYVCMDICTVQPLNMGLRMQSVGDFSHLHELLDVGGTLVFGAIYTTSPSNNCTLVSYSIPTYANVQAGGMEEWRRLKLKVLQQRIQRLVVLMELSEPGTIPDAGMLSSLIDLVIYILY